jgi:hypothetical protein
LRLNSTQNEIETTRFRSPTINDIVGAATCRPPFPITITIMFEDIIDLPNAIINGFP